MRSRTGLAVGVGLAVACVAGSASAIEIRSPRDGATVREKVRIVVPRANIPANGFVALYIDNDFILAQAPKQSGPLTFIWDTKQPRGKAGLTADEQTFPDGEHVIEVRGYDQQGGLVERDQVSVLLNNKVPTSNRQPVRLTYMFRPETKTVYALRTEAEATNTGIAGSTAAYPTMPGGYGAGMPGFPGGIGAGGEPGFPGGPEAGFPGGAGYPGAGVPGYNSASTATQSYTEFRKVSVFVNDNQGALSLLREYPENPITVVMNGTKQPVYVPQVSRYYFLNARGEDFPTAAMEREGKKPIYNVIRLPPYSVRVGDEWKSRINITLSVYSGQRIEATATNVVEAVEWELGQPSARIRSTYDYNGKITLPTLGFNDADAKLKGTSIIHFAPGTGKPMRATHTLEGDIIVDQSRQQNVAAGGLGGPGAPGMPGAMPGMAAGPEGPGMPGGYGYPGGGGVTGGGLTPQTQTYKAKIRATLTAQ